MTMTVRDVIIKIKDTFSNDREILSRQEEKAFEEEKTRRRIKKLLTDSVITDGAHHKQWYLEKIAEILNIPLPKHDEGIAP